MTGLPSLNRRPVRRTASRRRRPPSPGRFPRAPWPAFLVHKERLAVPEISFQDASGKARSLAEWRGRVVLLNLWATWCGPCREEMPELARLQAELGSPDFEVVALSMDRGGAEVAAPFLAKIGAGSLSLYLDPSGKALHAFSAIGLPATILIDRQGREIGRLLGPARWASPEAFTLIRNGAAGSSGNGLAPTRYRAAPARPILVVLTQGQEDAASMPYLEVLFIFCLLLLNGFLSMSELAVASSRPARLKAFADRSVRGARRALVLASDPGRFLSTVQIGITLIGILAGVLSGATLGESAVRWLMGLGLPESIADLLVSVGSSPPSPISRWSSANWCRSRSRCGTPSGSPARWRRR